MAGIESGWQKLARQLGYGLAVVLLVTGCSSSVRKAPVSRATIPASAKTYTVQRGDTLYSIARAHGRTVAQLSAWNGLRRPSEIDVGQVLQVSPPAGTKARAPARSTPAATPASRGQSQEERNRAIARANAEKINWMWPVQGKVVNSSDRNKKGVDINGQLGQAIVAAADGKVIYAGQGIRGYGQMLIIKHGEAWLSVYAHNDKILVKEGQNVRRGERIANMGKTDSDRVKLYFELRRNGDSVNPQQILAPM